MAVRSREEIAQLMQTRFGEEPDDEAISFMEDITDTLTDYENKASSEIDWETKYKENDEKWRKKYTERFYSGEPKEKDNEQPNNEPEKPKTFDDLFSTQ